MKNKLRNKASKIHGSYTQDHANLAVTTGNSHKNLRASKAQDSHTPAIWFFTLIFLSVVTGMTLYVRPLDIVSSSQEIIKALLIYTSLFMLGSVIAIALKFSLLAGRSDRIDTIASVFSVTVITSFSLLKFESALLFGAVTITTVTMLMIGRAIFKNVYSLSGVMLYASVFSTMIIGSIWAVLFYLGLDISFVSKALLASAAPFILFSIPSQLVGTIETFDALCRNKWHKMKNLYSNKLKVSQPFVSLHVPTYNEPPEVVIATLKHLSQIHYDNYEVIVIDNNTPDPATWTPVQDICAELGDNFKFYHVENLDGAKAGALNYIEKYCDPRTEVIGVIDADYIVNVNFLRDLMGHFENKKLGFIQTPHDYRAWKSNLFMRMCYWEYRAFFHTSMVALNEYDSGITVGTMCLIRKKAFEVAGGWSEWCVTEDSELAIRIHDKGYSSIYVNHTYGRGLIPESFETYKKQRYRWTAGPVQELRNHHYHLTGMSVHESKFSLIQRIFHLNHGLSHAILSFKLPLLFIALATITSFVLHREIIVVPAELWIVATVSLVSSLLLQYITYIKIVRASLFDLLLQTVASKALQHTITLASINTLVSGEAKWTRTNKFKESQDYVDALITTKEEISIAVLLLLFVGVAYSQLPNNGLATMLMIGIGYLAVDYLAAPLMALIGVWSSRNERTR